MHFGIDYGSKLAGTTVITYEENGVLYQRSSDKKQDADQMILSSVRELKPGRVFIDAPLSLPAAYFDKGENYFYRKADIDLKAMSPMFLGGLTARAMHLKKQMEEEGIDVFETYPGALVRATPELKSRYNKKDKTTIPEVLTCLLKMQSSLKLDIMPSNYHEIDSLLAWYSGYRHAKGTSRRVGDIKEGLIIF